MASSSPPFTEFKLVFKPLALVYRIIQQGIADFLTITNDFKTLYQAWVGTVPVG